MGKPVTISSSGTSDDEPLNSDNAATDEAAVLVVVPDPTTDNTETPANVAPDVARHHTAIAELNPVPNANTPPGPAATMEMLLEFGFTSEDSRPVDVQISGLLIGPL